MLGYPKSEVDDGGSLTRWVIASIWLQKSET
jgi:hypothetical protein